MMDESLAVVGGGQMGRALVGGMLTQGCIDAHRIHLVDPDPDCRRWWAEHHRQVQLGDDLQAAVADCGRVLLAVKPNILPLVARQPTPFWSGKLIISIVAGVQLQQLCQWVGHQRVVRVMPNTPSLVGEGASAFCGAAEVTPADLAWVESALAAVGLAIGVEEKQLDAVTGLSGSGPAYICMVIEALADGGVMAGLTRSVAVKLATQTVLGTAKMVAQSGRHPGELKDAVASPGGTTIAAIAALEQNGLRAALIEAVNVSAQRSRQLGESN
ncbi:MAG: pyrroline-5-carboxylate reductase [Pirellulales bacterium]|nr:pyrroline-5-carboxylate reductase [Pirellulales bacterium]